ncbi:chymotrypsin-1-like [Phymastichus coffea]|uniref:chymotrypsin-1-like n=1 Tax=Phymastichus coffea TaxID=108790 RepID=UPI00273BBB1C|nr:chymotrypsin-1-like [Phymastichus coffea]
MKFVLITYHLSLFLLTFSNAKHKSYGSKLARADQFPFVVSLSYNNREYCGASIIHERWILTAAHCLFKHDEEYGYLTDDTMVTTRSGITYKMKNLYKHPDFILIPEEENEVSNIYIIMVIMGTENEILYKGMEYVVNDIGLIRLSHNISFNDKVQPVTLATMKDGSYENVTATLPGWGRTSYGDHSHKYLRYITVRVLAHAECRRAWTYADKHICTSTREKQGACYGDSGSPLVVGNIQIGVTSTADTYCEALKPDLYTKVASFVPWIKRIMSHYGDILPDL